MSDRGVFAVDRGIFTDDLFADEPLTEREAWLWIIAEAAWKPRRTRVGVTTVDLDRGQLCHSVRFMAEAWRWSKSSVERFLQKLAKRDAIARTSGTATSVITVCRYDEFQRVCLPTRDRVGTENGTATGQQRDKLESIKTLTPSLSEAPLADAASKTVDQPKLDLTEDEEATKPTGRKPRKRVVYPQEFETLWSDFPTDANMSKQEAFKAWERLDEMDRMALARSIRPFKAWVSKQHNYRVVHLERYIKWRRFDGFAAKEAEPHQCSASSSAQQDDYLSSLSDDRWRDEIRRWKGTGCSYWPLRNRTEPPDSPRTKVPRHILAESNIQAGRARAA